jgi:hypothetical protein
MIPPPTAHEEVIERVFFNGGPQIFAIGLRCGHDGSMTLKDEGTPKTEFGLARAAFLKAAREIA